MNSSKQATTEAIEIKLRVVADELKRFNDEEYPQETKLLRDIFQLILDYLSKHVEEAKYRFLRSERELHERLHILGNVINELYAMMRYLRASATISTPPALQAIVRKLVESHFENDDCLTIVRPQWKYNCKFVSLIVSFGVLLNKRSVLIPDHFQFALASSDEDPRRNMIKNADVRRMLVFIADLLGKKDEITIPQSISVLSVAGLDRKDVLLYPMIAHEVAHMLSYEAPPGEHHQPTHQTQVVGSFLPTDDDLRRYAKQGKRKFRMNRKDRMRSDIRWAMVVCVRELIADLVAARMLGVGYFLTLAAYLTSMFKWDDPLIDGDTNYPSMYFRLKVVWDLVREQPEVKPLLLEEGEMARGLLAKILREWDRQLEAPVGVKLDPASDANAEMDGRFLRDIAAKTVIENLGSIVDKAAELVPSFESGIDDALDIRLQALRDRLPPLPDGENHASISPIFTAAWLHRQTSETFSVDDHVRLSRLVSKAIELTRLDRKDPPDVPAAGEAARAGVLTGHSIAERLRRPAGDPRRIAIIPTPEKIEAASIEVTLGNWFKVARRPKVAKIDLDEVKNFLNTGFLHDEFYVEENSRLTLHAGDFALGITREFIGMPRDVMAFVEGKSSIGRTGLIVATATQVAPGFHGCLVLELVNAGTIPLAVRPGMPIAQLVLMATSDIVSWHTRRASTVRSSRRADAACDHVNLARLSHWKDLHCHEVAGTEHTVAVDVHEYVYRPEPLPRSGETKCSDEQVGIGRVVTKIAEMPLADDFRRRILDRGIQNSDHGGGMPQVNRSIVLKADSDGVCNHHVLKNREFSQPRHLRGSAFRAVRSAGRRLR